MINAKLNSGVAIWVLDNMNKYFETIIDLKPIYMQSFLKYIHVDTNILFVNFCKTRTWLDNEFTNIFQYQGY